MESELLVVVVVIIAAYISLENAKIKQHDSILTGHLRYIEVVTHGNSALFFNHCGMQKHVFQLLLRKLTSAMGGLTDGTKIGAGEKIMMFLSVMRGNTYRDTSTVWQHGYKQVSKSVHEVLRSLLQCQQDLWDKPGENPVLSEYIRDNHHFFPYFHKCLGALDGTHIIAKVSPEMQQRFRGRKGVTQNVLGVCNFDMHFIIALAGWEGSAHDARVLHDAAVVRRILPLYDGWYYLGDAGYGLSLWCLTPFRGVRYHLSEWNAAIATNIFPQNARELFNMRHSKLRNVIERIYGVVKARYPILRDMPHGYDINTQCNIVLSSFLLHNFIRMNQNVEDVFDNGINQEDEGNINNANAANFMDDDLIPDGVNNEEAKVWRQSIADEMWADWLIAHPP